MAPTSAATHIPAHQIHQDTTVRPTFGLQVSTVFSRIRGLITLSLSFGDRRQRRRRVKDEPNAIELANLNEADVVSSGEGKDSRGEMLSSGRGSNDGDESGS